LLVSAKFLTRSADDIATHVVHRCWFLPGWYWVCRRGFVRRSFGYRCGQKAANDLDAFIERRPVECVEVDRDQYNRAVAVCTVAGVDLAEWLVQNGLALDWPQYSKRAYAAARSEAKRANLGMWGGSFQEPWRYRTCRRTGGTPVSCSDQL
jgi:endonuclease YncB( thermonuclease family)